MGKRQISGEMKKDSATLRANLKSASQPTITISDIVLREEERF